MRQQIGIRHQDMQYKSSLRNNIKSEVDLLKQTSYSKAANVRYGVVLCNSEEANATFEFTLCLRRKVVD